MAKRILIVEDNENNMYLISFILKKGGYEIIQAWSGEEGVELAKKERPDLIVMDIMLPGIDGMTFIEQLRRKNLTIPVIILSAKRSVDDRIRGLKAGGDDYLTKPFSFSELLVRIHALLRRVNMSRSPVRLEAADLSMDLLTREVVRAGRKVELQPREFSLLEYFLRNRGQVLSKTLIMEHVWDYHFDPQTNVVDVLVSRLRSKIDRGFDTKLLHTIRGVGYVLREPQKDTPKD